MTRRVIFGVDFEDRYELLKQKLDLFELFHELELEQVHEKGSEIWACCPYHNDRRPSWSMNADIDSDRWGVHHCFVCGEDTAGNVVGLVRYLRGLADYQSALKWLEGFCGFGELDENVLMELAISRRKKRSRTLQVGRQREEDPGILFGQFRAVTSRSEAWSYLLDVRGVTPKQIRRTGVRIGRDRYSGRVAFPIYQAGAVANFYARAYQNKDPKGLYARKKGTISTTLWGYEHANKLEDSCYLVEGVFDALTVQRLLPDRSPNVFATGGPIVHEEQAKLLKPFSEIVLVPDMKGHAKSIVPTARKWLTNKNLFVVAPPSGYDIDDYGREDPKSALRALTNPYPLRQSVVVKRVNYSIRK